MKQASKGFVNFILNQMLAFLMITIGLKLEKKVAREYKPHTLRLNLKLSLLNMVYQLCMCKRFPCLNVELPTYISGHNMLTAFSKKILIF